MFQYLIKQLAVPICIMLRDQGCTPRTFQVYTSYIGLSTHLALYKPYIGRVVGRNLRVELGNLLKSATMVFSWWMYRQIQIRGLGNWGWSPCTQPPFRFGRGPPPPLRAGSPDWDGDSSHTWCRCKRCTKPQLAPANSPFRAPGIQQLEAFAGDLAVEKCQHWIM